MSNEQPDTKAVPATENKFPTRVSKVAEAKYAKAVEVKDTSGIVLTFHKWAYRMENGDAGFLIGGTATEPQLKVGGLVAYTMNGQKILPQAMPAATAPDPPKNGTPPQADTTQHTGVVKAVKYVEQIKDGPHKWTVTLADGKSYVMWGPSDIEPPAREGQTITYIRGKVYGDGTQRIDLVAVGGKVDKDTSIIRQSSLKAAVETLVLASVVFPTHVEAANAAIMISRIYENYVSEPIKQPIQ